MCGRCTDICSPIHAGSSSSTLQASAQPSQALFYPHTTLFFFSSPLYQHCRSLLHPRSPPSRTHSGAHSLACSAPFLHRRQHGPAVGAPGRLVSAATRLTVRQNHRWLEDLLARNDLERPPRFPRLSLPNRPTHPHSPEPPCATVVYYHQRCRVPCRPLLTLRT